MSLHEIRSLSIDDFMDPRTLADRLRGGIAAFFLIDALSRLSQASTLILFLHQQNMFYSNWLKEPLFCLLELLIAVSLFYKKKLSTILASTFAALFFAVFLIGLCRTLISPSRQFFAADIWLLDEFFLPIEYASVLLFLLLLRRLEARNTSLS